VPPSLRVREVTAKSILNPSRISGVTYAINPYVGCQHACSYCYARFMSRYTGHQGEKWGSFVDAKVNGPRVLQQQLRRKQTLAKDPVLFSSVTDGYQPVERRFQITRRCLEVLIRHEFPISILTKSDLVLRDMDLIGQSSENEVGMTIISLDAKVRRVFEQGAPPSKRRLEALQTLSNQGIRTYGFVGPIIPYLSQPDLEELVRLLGECGVSYILFDRLNIKYGNRPVINQALQSHFRDQFSAITDALRAGSQYYENIREQIKDFATRYGVEADIIF
jgi:DNA repair photolyase